MEDLKDLNKKSGCQIHVRHEPQISTNFSLAEMHVDPKDILNLQTFLLSTLYSID